MKNETFRGGRGESLPSHHRHNIKINKNQVTPPSVGADWPKASQGVGKERFEMRKLTPKQLAKFKKTAKYKQWKANKDRTYRDNVQKQLDDQGLRTLKNRGII